MEDRFLGHSIYVNKFIGIAMRAFLLLWWNTSLPSLPVTRLTTFMQLRIISPCSRKRLLLIL